MATSRSPSGWRTPPAKRNSPTTPPRSRDTSTLLCGDLFTQVGDGPAIRTDSPMEATITAEDMFNYSSLAPSTAATVERLADLAPTTLALMHGPAHAGDGGQWLRDLAVDYRRRSELALAPG